MSRETNEEIFRFNSLRLQKMPGIDPPGFNINDLAPGVNIIHGPNAAGKTTVARALNLLLWPESDLAEKSLVSASFSLGAEEGWFVKLETGKREFEYSGTPGAGIELPPGEQADRYNLPLHQLLQEETTNESFAELIVREMFGGYNISAAVEELGFGSSIKGINNAKKAARKAHKKTLKAQEKLKNLKREQNELQRLKEKEKTAVQARRHVECLEQVINWFEVKQEFEAAQLELDRFPDVMEKVTGREIDELERLEKRIDELEDEIEEAKQIIEKNKKILDELKFPYDEPVGDRVAEIEERCEKIKELERDIEKVEGDLSEAKEGRRNEEKNLFENLDISSLEKIDGAGYGELEEFARRAEKIRNELDTLENFSDILEEKNVVDSSSDELKKGCGLLEGWLAHPSPENGEAPASYRYSLVVSMVVIAVLSGIAGSLIHPAFWAGLAILFVLYWYGWPSGESDRNSMRPAIERQYRELGLEIQPERWEETAVRDTLNKLYTCRAGVVVRELKTNEWQRHQDRYQDLRTQWKKIENQREEYIKKYGFAPETGDRTLFILFNRLSRWQDCDKNVRGLEKKLETKKEHLQKKISRVNKEFVLWELPEGQDGPEVNRFLTIVKSRNETFKETTRELDLAREKLEKAGSELPDRQKEFENLFRELDLQPGDEAGLRQLCEQRGDYRECRENISGKKSVVENERDKMEQMDEFDPKYKNSSAEELKEKLSEHRQEAERLEEIRKKITTIERDINAAKEGYELEDALADEERKFDRLEEYFEENCRKKVGTVLGEYIQQVNTEQGLPVVYKYAREILADMTAGRCVLVVDQGEPPSFRVKDARTAESKSLQELSSGTKVQVLMAVRLAFVEHGEKRTRFPVYMDETLANTDDERARVIIRSALRLAAAGRQVFYFTAQGDEVARWKAVARQQSEPVKVIDLVEERNLELAGAVEIPESFEFEFDVESELPSKQLSHAKYGEELKVPPVDPYRGINSIHLWYLIEDVELLDRLLTLQIKTWGQLENLLELGSQDVIDEARAKKIKQMASALEEFIECRKRGMNCPVDRVVLESSGAVTESFIDEVSELAAKYNGDPEKIIAGLENSEVSGFRSTKIEELEEYLEEEDYIDRRDPLAPEIVRAAMISALDPEVFDEPEKVVDRLLVRIGGNEEKQ